MSLMIGLPRINFAGSNGLVTRQQIKHVECECELGLNLVWLKAMAGAENEELVAAAIDAQP